MVRVQSILTRVNRCNEIFCNLGASDEELAGHALSVYLEGSEPTSQVLSFLLYDLARNPEVQDRLYDEVIRVLAKYDNRITYEAVQEMTYLDCVVQGGFTFYFSRLNNYFLIFS